MTGWKAALGVATMVGGLAGSSVAAAAPATPAAPRRPVKMFVQQVSATKSKILLTGAIGDYGTGISQDKNGKVDPNGAFQKITLKQGGFVVDGTGFNKALAHARPQVNKNTCSTLFTGSGPGTLGGGTGLYQGIGGKVTITATFADVAPRLRSGAKKGQCNFGGKTPPLASYQSITATGRVTFNS